MTSPWQLAFLDSLRFVGDELAVGEWTCDGTGTSHEVIGCVEVGLQQAGSHVRAVGPEQRLVDPTLATVNAIGDEIRTASHGPQRVTSLLVRGRLAEAVVPRVSGRFTPISSRVAHLHARLLDAPDALAVEERALTLLHRLATEAGAVRLSGLAPTPARRVLAEEARHVIATQFAERLTIEAIATACGSSAFYLSRVFRAVTGDTIHGHLTRVRLFAALFQLRRSAGRLTDLALAVGFSSHSHFTQAFRAEFGCAPTAL